MPRIYNNFTEEEFQSIRAAAEKSGMTPSAYCKAAIEEKLGKPQNADRLKDLYSKLENLPSGSLFIVSDLFSSEDWRSMTRPEKGILAKQLARFVRECPDKYTIHTILPTKVSQYKKL